MISDVEESIRSLLGCDVSITWVNERAEALGYVSEGHYKVTIGEHSFDVFSNDVLKSFINPSPMTKSILLRYKPRKKRWWKRA